ncbi:MAG: aminopeptidase P family protein [Nitrososphaerota archaeon]|nr:aminopeptidase P family protein [Nitrososphaerota archaeon]
MVDSAKRIDRIFKNIDGSDSIKPKPDLVVLGNGVEPHIDASFFYVTGIPYGLFEGSYLVGLRNGEVSLVTSKLEEAIARAHAKSIKVFAESDAAAIRSKLGQLAGKNKIVGFNSSELTYKSFQTIRSALRGSKFVDVMEAFENARLIKDANEVELIQKACDISSLAYKKIPSMLKEVITESQVAAKMAYEMQSAGGSGLAFESIIAFGKNSAEPHYAPGSTELKQNQFVLCDYGSRYRRYCSDITRTLVYGKASKKQTRIYSIVKEALELGIGLCTAENTGEEVNARVTKLIDSTEYKGLFIHSTGHSLGLSVHDGPGLSKNFKRKLVPGMVVTVEPGIYLPGFGGVRIEDDVLITKGKPRVLTSATRELIEV